MSEVCGRVIGAFADPDEICEYCAHKFSEHKQEIVSRASDDDDTLNAAVGVGLAASVLESESAGGSDDAPDSSAPDAPDVSGGGGEFSGGGASGDF